MRIGYSNVAHKTHVALGAQRSQCHSILAILQRRGRQREPAQTLALPDEVELSHLYAVQLDIDPMSHLADTLKRYFKGGTLGRVRVQMLYNDHLVDGISNQDRTKEVLLSTVSQPGEVDPSLFQFDGVERAGRRGSGSLAFALLNPKPRVGAFGQPVDSSAGRHGVQAKAVKLDGVRWIEMTVLFTPDDEMLLVSAGIEMQPSRINSIIQSGSDELWLRYPIPTLLIHEQLDGFLSGGIRLPTHLLGC